MTKETEERTAIVSYLAALNRHNAPKPRGRKRTIENIARDISACEQVLATTMDPIRRLHATQELMNCQREAQEMAENEALSNPALFEADFIAHIAGYSERNNITPAALRAVGVPARVIREAGLT